MPRQGPRSVLDDLGEEITGIIAPVSICMALVVVLVKVLNPEGTADTTTVAIATIAYQEKDTDSAGQKLGGALLNAIIFMAVIAAMTFVLFLLFKWGCYKVIYGYMGFAMLNIFFFFTGALVLQLLRLVGLHVDLFSLAFLLYNFSVLGILSLFVLPVPLFLKQCYTVWVGICVAYIFTHIPEWTSWVLLVIMALYDLVAVLLPGGPLKILVELAIERQQELPALVYESRPVGRPYQRGMWRRQPGGDGTGTAAAAAAAASAGGTELSVTPTAAVHVALLAGQRASSDDASQEMAFAAVPGNMSSASNGRAGAGAVPLAEGKESSVQQQQLAVLMRRAAAESAAAAVQSTAAPLGEGVEQESAAAAALLAGQGGSSAAISRGGTGSTTARAPSSSSSSRQYNVEAAGFSASLPDAVGAAGLSLPAGNPAAAASVAAAGSTNTAIQSYAGDTAAPGSTASGDDEMELPDGIKLGLGDFIFYSMLVGRAAMYDFMTVYASYIAVISGLGITLMLLALYRKALPALPVSIALGVVFYFLTRLVMEPFVVPLSLNLAYY